MAEKNLLLQILDQYWKDHLLRLDHLRQGIGLRALGQKNPLNEYKREAFDMFDDMLDRLREGITTLLNHIEIQPDSPNSSQQKELNTEAQHTSVEQFSENGHDSNSSNQASLKSQPKRYPQKDQINPDNQATWGKVSRNAACPCGSGKKYKHCHGKL